MDIVLTCGVFDLFHIGHLNILKGAKALGDKLIVALSTDELCFEIKKKKPIFPYKDRKEILESVEYVDLVIPQHNLNKKELVEKLKPDILVVGDDWYKKGYGGENLGVKVVYLPSTKKISTSKIIKTIKGEV